MKAFKKILEYQVDYWQKELEKRKADPLFSDFKIKLAERKLESSKKQLKSYTKKLNK